MPGKKFIEGGRAVELGHLADRLQRLEQAVGSQGLLLVRWMRRPWWRRFLGLKPRSGMMRRS